MLQNQQSNSNSSTTKLNDYEDLIKKIRSQDRKIVGLYFSCLPIVIISSAISSIINPYVTAAIQYLAPFMPIIGITVAAVALFSVALFSAYKAYQHRVEIKESTEKALKKVKDGTSYVAEKTVDGFQYTAGKIKDGAVYSKDKVNEGLSNAKTGIGNNLMTLGKKMHNSGRKMSNSHDLKQQNVTSLPSFVEKFQTINNSTHITEEKTNKYNNIVTQFNQIGKTDSIKNILKEMESLLDSKIESLRNEPIYDLSVTYFTHLVKQKNYITELSTKDLKKLLKDTNNPLYDIFSEHYDGIKEIVSKCKVDCNLNYNLPKTLEKLNKAAKTPDNNRRHSQLSDISDGSSVSSSSGYSTDGSRAELLNPEKHKSNKFFRFFTKDTKSQKTSEACDIEYISIPGKSATITPNALRRGNTVNLVDRPQLKAFAPPKPPRTFTSNFADGLNGPTQLTPIPSPVMPVTSGVQNLVKNSSLDVNNKSDCISISSIDSFATASDSETSYNNTPKPFSYHNHNSKSSTLPLRRASTGSIIKAYTLGNNPQEVLSKLKKVKSLTSIESLLNVENTACQQIGKQL